MKSAILGQAYVARSVNAADNRLINLYPEATPEGGKENGFLTRAPGLRALVTVGLGPIRGLWSYNSIGYVVSGTELYSLTTAWVATLIGTIAGTGPVSMTDNGYMLCIVANPKMYTYNGVALTEVTDANFVGAATVDFVDGFFIFNEPDTQRLWSVSTINPATGSAIDPLVFSSLDFSTADGSPDLVIAVKANHRELWVFGTKTVEVWYNAGLSNFPLTRIQGAFNEIGCAAVNSVAKMDNAMFWVGSDDRGKGIVYKAQGYSGQRISTHAIEFAIQGYADISDAVAFTYQQEGHSFYVLNFPSANASWTFDVASGAWHERAYFNAGEFHRYRPNSQLNFSNEIVVGDFEDGNLYALDLDEYADQGSNIQKWLRSWRALPPGQNNLKRTSQHSLQLDCESGVGLNSGQGSDPQVMLRWSDDGGHTWSNEHWAGMGKIGQYYKRVIWRRLGMTDKLRDRVYEISGTDPVKIAIMGAELFVTPTNA